jgi:hypothetical protein
MTLDVPSLDFRFVVDRVVSARLLLVGPAAAEQKPGVGVV